MVRHTMVLFIIFTFFTVACGAQRGNETTVGYPSWVQDAVSAATGAVAEALGDGKVSPAELERAGLNAISCMERQGVIVEDYSFKGSNYNIVYALTSENDQNTPNIEERCFAKYYDLLAIVYMIDNAPTQQELQLEREEIAQLIFECMRGRGITLSRDLTLGDLDSVAQAHPDEHRACLMAVDEELES